MRIVAFLFLILLIEAVEAHEPLNEQINEVTTEIRQHPRDIEVLIKRGRLRLDSGSYDAAVDDFHHVLSMNPKNIAVHYYLAETYLAQNNNKRALAHANEFIHHASSKGARSRGFELLGRIQIQAKNYSQAIQAYQQLVNLTTLPKPEYYLILADTYIRVDKNDNASAISVLDEGMHKLGLLPVLQKQAIDYEIHANNLQQAIQRVDKLIVANPHSFAFLKLKADILWQQGKKTQAKSVYQSSIALLDKLPTSRKQSPGIHGLRNAMESRL